MRLCCVFLSIFHFRCPSPFKLLSAPDYRNKLMILTAQLYDENRRSFFLVFLSLSCFSSFSSRHLVFFPKIIFRQFTFLSLGVGRGYREKSRCSEHALRTAGCAWPQQQQTNNQKNRATIMREGHMDPPMPWLSSRFAVSTQLC